MQRAYPGGVFGVTTGNAGRSKGDELSDERGRRVGINEALFRQVNEEIRGLDKAQGTGVDSTITVICECGDADCTERLELRTSEYERIRGDSLRYVIASGHELGDVEVVLERHDGWEVVRKAGAAGEVSEETDPRA
jgi:hypothetical protein